MYLDLPESVSDALVNLALSEWRRPRDQATKLLIESLERAGALPKEVSDLTTTAREAVPASCRT
jgi:hypothetical protein